MSEVETIRNDIAAMRADMDARFAKVEAKLDEKPGAATLYQVAFGAPVALVVFASALIALSKALSLI